MWCVIFDINPSLKWVLGVGVFCSLLSASDCSDDLLKHSQSRNLGARMNQITVVTLQNLFFPRLKVAPKANWKEKLKAFGTVADIKIQRNGRTLSVIEITPRSGSNGNVVVMAHPISKRAKYFFAGGSRIQTYLNAGYSVVLYDFNGFGESDRIDLYYWRDTEAVIAHARARNRGHMILHGVSFGAFHIARAVPTLPQGSTVVFENVSRSLYDYWKRWRLTAAAVKIIQTTGARSFAEMDIMTPLHEMNRPDLKLIFIACETDAFTPADEMRDLAAVLPQSQVVFIDIPGAGHLEAPEKAAGQYAQALQDGMRK